MEITIYFIATAALVFTLLQVTAKTTAPNAVFIKETFGAGTQKTSLPASSTTHNFDGNS